MGDTKATGLDALRERMDQIESGDTNSDFNVPADEDAIETKSKEEQLVEDAFSEEEDNSDVADSKEKEADSEIEAKVKETKEEGETSDEENVYSPSYQYKFQDEMFEFDDRVKSAIKTPEDEEFFRDLYTKSRAMEIMKQRAEETSKSVSEWENKYTEVEGKYKETDNMVNYFTQLMDGVNRGDAKAFNQFLSLCNVNKQALVSIGETLAEHIENPQGFQATQSNYQAEYQQSNLQKEQERMQQQQIELARTQTELEVKKALSSPEIQEVAQYVDNVWGPGTFEKRVWSEGQALEAQNKSVSFDDIPNIVKDVANWFSKAKPQNENSSQQASTNQQAPVQTRIVDNPTSSLPKVQGERGVPRKPVYTSGSGIDGLKSRYKDLTGNEW